MDKKILKTLAIIIAAIHWGFNGVVLTPMNWFYYFIIAVTTGSGAILLCYYLLNRVKAIVSSICEMFFPLSAIIFDYIINGQMLSPVK